MGRAGGLSWDEMGLAREALRADLLAAAAAATVTIGGVAAVAMHPRTPDVGDLARHATPALARRAALGTIPLSVAVPEEVAFRGVLDASLRRHLRPGSADLVGALAFGAWHVLGATPVGSGPRGRLLGAALTVAATTVAGLGFTALRRRSGSVLPGIAGHWALNGTAAVVVAARTSHAVAPATAGRP